MSTDLPQTDGLTDGMRSDVQQTLSALANSSSNIKRFNTSILVKPNGKDESDVNTWSRQLTNAHTITPTESVNVVSETAKMPVTISNSHPYPVKVKVSSLTDSMQIVTSRFDTVQVPPHGEAQVAFTIRVSTSGTANATISLFDRNGAAFGATQVTHITSALQMSGFVIIGFAVLLGAVGLWRQFNRKKDPDE